MKAQDEAILDAYTQALDDIEAKYDEPEATQEINSLYYFMGINRIMRENNDQSI